MYPASPACCWPWHPQDRQQMEPGQCPFSHVGMWPLCHAHRCCNQPCALERERTPVVAPCVLPHKPCSSAQLQTHSRTRRGYHCSRNLGQVCVNRWEGQEAAVPSTIGGAKGVPLGCSLGPCRSAGHPESSAGRQAHGHQPVCKHHKLCK